MLNKMVFGLLVLLISSGMGLGIAKNLKNKADYPPVPADLQKISGEFKWNSVTPGQNQTGPHLSMDEITKLGNDLISNYQTGIELVRIIETTNYFYMIFRETATGIGAFELLVDPVTGQMGFETGPSQLWNTKYGIWSSGKYMSNVISEVQAQYNAAKFLKNENPMASIDPKPVVFHGYYSFLEVQDGQIIGVLSVNGFNGDITPHDWLGKVLQTREFSNNKS